MFLMGAGSADKDSLSECRLALNRMEKPMALASSSRIIAINIAWTLAYVTLRRDR